MRFGIKLTAKGQSWSTIVSIRDIKKYITNQDFSNFVRPITFEISEVENFKDHYIYYFLDELSKEDKAPKFLFLDIDILVETINL